MANNLTNICLSKLFDGRYFRIPDYQRGYAWEDPQLKDLWEDIEDIQMDDNGNYVPHFTGAITLKERTSLSSEETYLRNLVNNEFDDVVDGQQRLTTLAILMVELLKVLPQTLYARLESTYIGEKADTGNMLYKLTYQDATGNNNQFLLKEIFGYSNALPTKPNTYTKNLSNAHSFFGSKVKSLSPQDAQDLYTKISNSLIFDVKYVGSNLDVQAVFETMNNRGKSLTTLEKLKNRLMYLSTKLPASGDLSSKINTAWGIIYNQLGANSNVALKEDEFLSAHLSLLREPTDDVYSESLASERLFKMFCTRAASYDVSDARQHVTFKPEPMVDYQKIDDYATDLSNFVQYWYAVYFPNSVLPIGQTLMKIQYLDGSKTMKLILSELIRHNSICKRDVEQCLDNILQILKRNSLPNVRVMDPHDLVRKVRELHKGNCTVADINNELNAVLSIPITRSLVVSGFSNLFDYQRGKIGFYRWAGLKYFLMEYEDHIRRNATKRAFAHILWDNFAETSIEHILPQTYRPDWEKEMSAYKITVCDNLGVETLQPKEETAAEKIIVNTLGNFTIIQNVRNTTASNTSWTDKRAVYANGCYSEVYLYNNYSDWDALSIKQHGLELLEFMCKDFLDGALTLTDAEKDQILFHDVNYRPCCCVICE